jgi:hypothetical protein
MMVAQFAGNHPCGGRTQVRTLGRDSTKTGVHHQGTRGGHGARGTTGPDTFFNDGTRVRTLRSGHFRCRRGAPGKDPRRGGDPFSLRQRKIPGRFPGSPRASVQGPKLKYGTGLRSGHFRMGPDAGLSLSRRMGDMHCARMVGRRPPAADLSHPTGLDALDWDGTRRETGFHHEGTKEGTKLWSRPGPDTFFDDGTQVRTPRVSKAMKVREVLSNSTELCASVSLW